jgi:hypothetical protein
MCNRQVVGCNQRDASPRDASVNLMLIKPLVSGTYICMALWLSMPLAQAALGGDVASVIRDHQALSATHEVTTLANYEIHEGRSPTGLHLREYVDHSGREFAVSWQSANNAGISRLLGAYADRYHAAALARRGGHHVLSINTPDLALTVTRLPRGWLGLAILPDALPEGVSRAGIR